MRPSCLPLVHRQWQSYSLSQLGRLKNDPHIGPAKQPIIHRVDRLEFRLIYLAPRPRQTDGSGCTRGSAGT